MIEHALQLPPTSLILLGWVYGHDPELRTSARECRRVGTENCRLGGMTLSLRCQSKNCLAATSWVTG